MRVLWVTNRPIAKAEKKLQIEATSGTWMEPTLDALSKRRDISVAVATVTSINQVESFVDESVLYYLLPADKCRMYEYTSKKHVEEWKKVFDEYKPDIVMLWGTEYSHGLCALLIAHERSIPSVVEIQGIMESIEYYYLSNLNSRDIKKAYSIRNIFKHDGLYEEKNFYLKKSKIEEQMLKISSNVIIENKWAEAHCRYIAPDAKFFMHHQNVNEVFFTKRWSIDKCEPYSIITTVPIYPLKGFHILLKAISIVKKEFPDVKVYVPGIKNPFTKSKWECFKQQGYEKYYTRMIKQLGLQNNIEFLGILSSSEMAAKMEQCKLMVVPSSIENTSTTLREAMAIGLPCIGSYVGGIPETIQHGKTGYIFRHEEYVMLAEYIKQIFENDLLAVEFGKNGRTVMQEYLDIDQSTKALVEIYNTIINRKKNC